MGVHPPLFFLVYIHSDIYFTQCCTVYEGLAQARPNEGLARKDLCTWSFLQVAPSKRLKTTEIAFIPVGDYIFLPTNEVL